MYQLIVRAKKDSDALKAMARVFYPDWNLRISTLKGARGINEVRKNLEDMVDELLYNIILVGREDAKFLVLEDEFPENVVFFMVDKKRIRNARIITLSRCFERARAIIRNSAQWQENAYVFSHKDAPFVKYSIPAYDLFLGLGEGYERMLEILLGTGYKCTLFVRGFGGTHETYCGPSLVAKIKIPDTGKVKVLSKEEAECLEIKEEDLVSSNRDIVQMHERISLNFLKHSVQDVDHIVVPWSGGRDSTTALILSLKAFGSKHVTAVYVDTGVDFPSNIEYVKKVAARLGVRVEYAYAPIKESLPEKGLPTHNNRWCTILKVNALHEKIFEIYPEGKIALVVGDRDAESRPRSMRPPIRWEGRLKILSPLKNWSTALAQLYLLFNEIPLNPLYLKGFYRLGCYICPALRSWEVKLLKIFLMDDLQALPYFKEFMRSREALEGENRG